MKKEWKVPFVEMLDVNLTMKGHKPWKPGHGHSDSDSHSDSGGPGIGLS
ncbi:paeninodin family lasso peptide [Fredinandcohnia quinoae]|uniref:Paeninodin family lasso peptide n=1 Tax=Fredinandcohnia quinoae TaxID=2918902 RepID=A0AAW5E7W7_9BACI|nr:paeninodin family lasso peptide [Fredinandcohnia sp. SECRCQ15]MCH1624879.1 paeninodin family lasso peptide [Fredinandcohnia sp. SECRCQ15]